MPADSTIPPVHDPVEHATREQIVLGALVAVLTRAGQLVPEKRVTLQEILNAAGDYVEEKPKPEPARKLVTDSRAEVLAGLKTLREKSYAELDLSAWITSIQALIEPIADDCCNLLEGYSSNDVYELATEVEGLLGLGSPKAENQLELACRICHAKAPVNLPGWSRAPLKEIAFVCGEECRSAIFSGAHMHKPDPERAEATKLLERADDLIATLERFSDDWRHGVRELEELDAHLTDLARLLGVVRHESKAEEHGELASGGESIAPDLSKVATVENVGLALGSVPWTNAGGPGECAHGYAAGLECPKCARPSSEFAKGRPVHLAPRVGAAPQEGCVLTEVERGGSDRPEAPDDDARRLLMAMQWGIVVQHADGHRWISADEVDTGCPTCGHTGWDHVGLDACPGPLNKLLREKGREEVRGKCYGDFRAALSAIDAGLVALGEPTLLEQYELRGGDLAWGLPKPQPLTEDFVPCRGCGSCGAHGYGCSTMKARGECRHYKKLTEKCASCDLETPAERARCRGETPEHDVVRDASGRCSAECSAPPPHGLERPSLPKRGG